MTTLSPADQYASEVALDIRQSEALIGDTTIKLADMLSAAVAGRREAGLSAVTGQHALTKAARALLMVTEAGAELAAAHTSAERVARKMNLEFGGLIPTEPKPDDEKKPVPTGRAVTAP